MKKGREKRKEGQKRRRGDEKGWGGEGKTKSGGRDGTLDGKIRGRRT